MMAVVLAVFSLFVQQSTGFRLLPTNAPAPVKPLRVHRFTLGDVPMHQPKIPDFLNGTNLSNFNISKILNGLNGSWPWCNETNGTNGTNCTLPPQFGAARGLNSGFPLSLLVAMVGALASLLL